jgi:hypothetical protein
MEKRVITNITDACLLIKQEDHGVSSLVKFEGENEFFRDAIHSATDGEMYLHQVLPRAEQLFDSITADIHKGVMIRVYPEKTFVSYVFKTFERSLATCGSLSVDDAHPLGSPDYRGLVLRSMMMYMMCLIKDTMTMSMETMRLILASKFPAAEKIFYQFRIERNSKTPGDSTPKHIPRFDRMDLCCMLLATYMCPGTSVPGGLRAMEFLFDPQGLFSRKKMMTHVRNLDDLGFLWCFYYTIASGAPPSSESKPRQLSDHKETVSTLVRETSTTHAKRFLEHYGFAEPNSCSSDRETKDVLSRFSSVFRPDGHVLDKNERSAGSMAPPKKRRKIERIEVEVPISLEFAKRFANEPKKNQILTAESTSADDPAKMLLLQSLVSSAVSRGKVLLQSRSKKQRHEVVEDIKSQFIPSATRKSGPLCLMLDNKWCPS